MPLTLNTAEKALADTAKDRLHEALSGGVTDYTESLDGYPAMAPTTQQLVQKAFRATIAAVIKALAPADWVTVTLGAGQTLWTESDTVQAKVDFLKRVQVRGILQRTSTSSNSLGTLPDGMRPSRRLIVPISCDDKAAFLTINTDGSLVYRTGPTIANGATVHLSLDGISFEAA